MIHFDDYTDYPSDLFKFMNPLDIKEGQKPIYRGCGNRNGCLCSGRCKEIIGWEEVKSKSILDRYNKITKTMQEAFYEYLVTKMPQLFNRGVCSFKIGDEYPTRAVDLYKTFVKGYEAGSK